MVDFALYLHLHFFIPGDSERFGLLIFLCICAHTFYNLQKPEQQQQQQQQKRGG